MDIHETDSYHVANRRAQPSGGQGMIQKIIPEEEESFGTTIKKGINMMKKMWMTAALAATMTAAVSFGALAAEEKIEAGGIVVEIPEKFKDIVTVQTEDLQPDELIRVAETASIEAAKVTGSNDALPGWLFSISRITGEELGKLRCGEMSGSEVFAEDDDMYYLFNHPTDVRLIREPDEEMDTAMDQWTDLNDWAWQDVRMAILSANPQLEPETCSNTELDMYLCRARYDGMKYEIRSLDAGTFDPTIFGEDDYLEDLTEDVWYDEDVEISDEEKADGEYIVMAFDEDNVRFDFFLGEGMENLIREVKTMDDGEEVETLYRASFKDPEDSATGIMKEWIANMMHTDDDGDDGIDD